MLGFSSASLLPCIRSRWFEKCWRRWLITSERVGEEKAMTRRVITLRWLIRTTGRGLSKRFLAKGTSNQPSGVDRKLVKSSGIEVERRNEIKRDTIHDQFTRERELPRTLICDAIPFKSRHSSRTVHRANSPREKKSNKAGKSSTKTNGWKKEHGNGKYRWKIHAWRRVASLHPLVVG